jgi:hypothetical protein
VILVISRKAIANQRLGKGYPQLVQIRGRLPGPGSCQEIYLKIFLIELFRLNANRKGLNHKGFVFWIAVEDAREGRHQA